MRNTAEKRVSAVAAALVAVLCLAVLAGGLLVVELVPNPPLLAPAFTPSRDMLGHWNGAARISPGETAEEDLLVRLTIRADSSVDGRIGDARLSNGRMMHNRSWLGELLDLRTDYLILADLSWSDPKRGLITESVSMPLFFRGDSFQGTLLLQSKPRRLMLFRTAQQ